jgi:hypothetical protein
MTDTTYNGYANRETWLVNLHLLEDPFLENQLREATGIAAQHAEESFPSDLLAVKHFPSFRVSTVADYLEGWVEELLDPMEHPFADRSAVELMRLDLLKTALRQVDWHELARYAIEDYLEEHPDDNDADWIVAIIE